jgi:pimeloyl-ACP methyl ester carboxylesterase
MSSNIHFSAVVVIVLTCVLTPSRTLAADDTLAGDWAGGFERGADFVFLQLHFKAEDQRLSGTYDAPLLFQHGRPLEQVATDGSKVSFEIPGKPHSQQFGGEVKHGIISGQMKEGAATKAFRFTRLAPVKAEHYVGTYEIWPGHFMFIRASVELGIGALQFIDFKTGRVGVLFPTSATSFFTGPAVLVPHPIDATVQFTLDAQGRATDLAWAGAEGKEKWSGRRVKLKEEKISVTNGNVSISGTLLLPRTPPPHPVVICVAGGTAAGTREMFRHIAELYAVNGVASLIYDKRGLGNSTGDWLRAGFDDLAGDALALVRLLKTRPGIDPRRIGLFGASQSGWVVALSASRSPDVAFIISQSGSGVTPEEQELFRAEAWLRADGFPDQDVREAMDYIRRRYQCALTGEGWDALAEAEGQLKNKTWFAYTGGSVGKDDPFWHFWSLIRGYDPVPALEKVKCPVLAVFGAKDTFVPVEKSARVWRTALEKAGNRDVTIRVFPDGDHSLIESKTGGLKEVARARRFVPGYFETVLDWTLKRARFEN